MLQKVNFNNIQWNTDGEKIELPNEITLEVEIDENEDANEWLAENGADVLSELNDWCVYSFNFTIQEKD